MKKLSLLLIMLFSLSIFSQSELSYEDIRNSERRPNTRNLEKYTSKNGEVFKVGEILKIGEPKGSLDRYEFIQKVGALGDQIDVTLEDKGFESEIIKFKLIGGKRRGYEIQIVSKTPMGLHRYYIQIEKAIRDGEVQSTIMTREEAISKLKEEKDLLDLGLITEKEYNDRKEKLTPIILEN